MIISWVLFASLLRQPYNIATIANLQSIGRQSEAGIKEKCVTSGAGFYSDS